jgi:uncharacterized protein YjbI with pentapeptide repeats
MKTKYLLPFILLVGGFEAQARKQQEYQYKPDSSGNYRCLNQNQMPGFNQGYLGECGQISGKTFDYPEMHRSGDGLQAEGTYFKNADFSGARFRGANLKSSHFQNSNFNSALIRRSDLTKAMMDHTLFKAALLDNLEMVDGTLDYSDFDGALLTSVEFSRSSLQFANFKGALLTSIDFTDVDLRGADFTNAGVSDIRWRGAIYNNSTKLPFSESQAAQEGMVKKE